MHDVSQYLLAEVIIISSPSDDISCIAVSVSDTYMCNTINDRTRNVDTAGSTVLSLNPN